MVLWLTLARCWGAGPFGRFNFLYAYAATWGILFDFGLDLLLTRFVSARGGGIPSSLIRVKAGVLAVGYLLCLATARWAGWAEFPVLAVLAAGVALFSVTTFVNGFLRGMERLDVEAGISLAQKVTFMIPALLGVLYAQQSLAWVAAAYMGSHVLGLMATMAYVWPRPEFRVMGKLAFPLKDSFRASFSFWLISLFTIAGQRLDLFMLQALGTEEQVGLYSAAFRIVEGFVYFQVAFMAGFFPRLVQRAGDDKEFGAIVKRSAGLLFFGGLLVAAINQLCAPVWVPVLFGEEFRASAAALQALGWSLPCLYTSAVLGHALVACGRQRLFMAALLVALLANGGLDRMLIPLWGLRGAVAGFCCREGLLLMLLGTFYLGVRSGRFSGTGRSRGVAF